MIVRLLLLLLLAMPTLSQAAPVTSYRLDLSDDPENEYSEAPKLDWELFGGRTRILTRYPNEMPIHRELLGEGYVVATASLPDFSVPLKNQWVMGVVTGQQPKDESLSKPALPAIICSEIGKAIYPPGESEQPHHFELGQIKEFQKLYPNVIYAGGRVAEIDDMIGWTHKGFFERPPISPAGTTFPAAFQDAIEADSKRGGVPYLYFQHNAMWALPYTASARITSMIDAQIMARDGHVIVPQFAVVRSATRQHPGPFGVQFSGQVGMRLLNPKEVLKHGAEPVWEAPKDSNYSKSHALSRQMLYYSWLNGARFFMYETGYGFNHDNVHYTPSPLAHFTAGADKVMEKVGFTGPTQTPIALISEFSHVWDKPSVHPSHHIFFNNVGVPYDRGDYQRHGLTDFFYPFYLQTGIVYDSAKREDYSITPTPYGSSMDFMLSDARPEALKRYGLLVWAGVPPSAPAMVRDKLLDFIRDDHGRAVVFGTAARAMFPEHFAGTREIGEGAKVEYNGSSFTEKAGFVIEELKSTDGMQVLATVNGLPLVVECHGGLVIVLSDYGLNQIPYVDPSKATWNDNEIITNIPYQLLEHARRVLAIEASKQYLFDVGNNALTYIVTRPGRGEYLLGLFNDRKTSEPFKITSRIGGVASMEEIELNDGKDLLKSVVNGAAYVEAGLRSSPNLPLDYGLSDAAHIEGRDFRLFRIKVAENNVREIAQFTFPPRPAGNVVSVPGLLGIRRYLQGIPSFLQWFDGVEITARSLLDMDPIWLAEEKYWLDRRGVRVVVDGRGLSDADALGVIEKLGLLDRAPKDLIIESPGDPVKAAASRHKVRLVAPGAVNRLAAPEHRFKPEATLNVMDLFYRDEQDLYLDRKHFQGDPSSAVLMGSPDFDNLLPAPPVTNQPGTEYLNAGTDVHDLKSLVEHHAAGLAQYKGIKIDSTYLLSKTTKALTEDAAVLKKHRLDVVVDLRRDQFHPDLITFYPHFPNSGKGVAMFRNIVGKMPLLGAKDLIVGVSDMYGDKPVMIAQRDGAWVGFAKIASEQGVNLHLVGKDPKAKLSGSADLSLANVFVIDGLPGGKRSPYVLIGGDGKATGTGSTRILDADRGLYFNDR